MHKIAQLGQQGGRSLAVSDWSEHHKALWFDNVLQHYNENVNIVTAHDLGKSTHSTFMKNKDCRSYYRDFMDAYLEGVVST